MTWHNTFILLIKVLFQHSLKLRNYTTRVQEWPQINVALALGAIPFICMFGFSPI
jgi:hypothetical protein